MADGGEATGIRGADAADFADGQLFVWGAGFQRGFVYTEATDRWRPVATAGQPPPRAGASVVWANGRVLWWGTRAGHVYDPATDTWSAMETIGAPSARERHSAVWTGTRMIVWGGQNEVDPRFGFARDGALYDPVQNTWTAMSTEGAPSGRVRHVTVWTGTRMLVWGGQNEHGALADGAAFDPVANRWTPIASANAPGPRFLHSAVWTGSEMFVWGGRGCADNDELEEDDNTCDDGARYDPVKDHWLSISDKDAADVRVASAAVWSGREVILWGGLDADQTGRRWEPIRDAWLRIQTANAPAGRGGAFAFWTGSRMLVWGGEPHPATGGYYQP